MSQMAKYSKLKFSHAATLIIILASALAADVVSQSHGGSSFASDSEAQTACSSCSNIRGCDLVLPADDQQ